MSRQKLPSLYPTEDGKRRWWKRIQEKSRSYRESHSGRVYEAGSSHPPQRGSIKMEEARAFVVETVVKTLQDVRLYVNVTFCMIQPINFQHRRKSFKRHCKSLPVRCMRADQWNKEQLSLATSTLTLCFILPVSSRLKPYTVKSCLVAIETSRQIMYYILYS